MITTPPEWRETTVQRVLRLLDRPAQAGLGVITAYRDGEVTLRSNRREDGYTFSDTENGYQEIRPGDLVFHALDGFAGAVGVSDSHGNGSPVYHVCKPVAGDDPAYLARLLRHLGTSGFLATQAPNVRERSVDFRNWSTFARIPLVLPPADAQRAIADYLDRETARIDTLIDEQQRLIEMLRERRRAVISSALAPTDVWVRRRIKHIGETSLGKMLDAGRVVRDGDRPQPYVRAADVRADGSVNLMDLNVMPFSDTEMDVFDLRAGDVLLIEGGATVGRPGFMFESAPGIAFQKTVNRLRVGSQADARFVYWSMLRLYESAYYANHYGSVSFVHLTGEKLREIELRLPPLDEQRAIAAYIDERTAKIDTLIAETDRFVELARERRSALITAAVTGQIDVREMA